MLEEVRVPELPASFGAVELLLSLLFTWFLFWQNNRLRNLSRRITHNDVTAANYTVLARTAHGALPHRAPPPRCTADLVHHVWHR